MHETRAAETRGGVTATLSGFTALGQSLLEAHGDGASLEDAVGRAAGWEHLTRLVATARTLTDTLGDDPLAHVDQGYHRFRRYAPRMLRCLDLEAAPVARPLLDAATAIATKDALPATYDFLRPHSKWRRQLRAKGDNDARLREVAVMFHLRDALRSGDICLVRSHRYGDLRHVLVPMAVARAAKLAVPPTGMSGSPTARRDLPMALPGSGAPRATAQGEIRDRTTEGQHYRIAGLNVLTAIIVYWNTLHLGQAVDARRREGIDTPDHLLAHISPLGWAHILLTGEYLWPKDASA